MFICQNLMSSAGAMDDYMIILSVKACGSIYSYKVLKLDRGIPSKGRC